MCEPKLLRLSKAVIPSEARNPYLQWSPWGRDASTPNEFAARPRSALSMTEMLASLIRLPCLVHHRAAGNARGHDDSLG